MSDLVGLSGLRDARKAQEVAELVAGFVQRVADGDLGAIKGVAFAWVDGDGSVYFDHSEMSGIEVSGLLHTAAQAASEASVGRGNDE